jgi:ElaB protein
MFNRFTRAPEARAQRAAQMLNRNPAEVARAEIRLLISTVDELVERLSTVADPELQRLSRQTAATLESAKAAVADRQGQLRDQAEDLAEQGDTYVREHPWATLGVVALAMLAIGLWTGRASLPEWR